MTSELPEQPNLEQLKKRAKGLLHSAHTKDPEALERFRILPSNTHKTLDQIAAELPALHDAQSVIAREHGFPSWNALREEVEERTLTPQTAAEAFLRAAIGGAPDRARRLLALYPAIAHASPQAAAVLGEVEFLSEAIGKDPGLALRHGGHEDWELLQYLCQSVLFRQDHEGERKLVAVARLLLKHGANPNAQYHWTWHPELPRTVLWGSLCTVGSLPLAKELLEAGAEPTDGVSMHILLSTPNMAALELLLSYGAKVDGIPGGVPPLRYVLGYARRPEGLYWLLSHGADPNLAWGEGNEAPIHLAARRWDVPMAEALAARGAELDRKREDGRTAYVLARLNGNDPVADWLEAHGALTAISVADQFAAACARADTAEIDRLRRETPGISGSLGKEHHLLLHRVAEKGQLAALEAMLAAGFDPRIRDADKVTPLHRAAMGGHAEAVAMLLKAGASAADIDGMFVAPPLVWAVEGSGHPAAGSNYPLTARLLIDAGTPPWHPQDTSPHVEGTLERLDALKRAAAAIVH